MKKYFPLFLVPGLLLADGQIASDGAEVSNEIALSELPFLPENPLVNAENLDLESIELYEPRRKSAFWAATLSGLIPGLGHAYLGEYKTAGILFGSVGALGGLGTTDLLSDSFQSFNQGTMASLAFYSTYAAYRDARAYNQFSGYKYPMPNESGFQLALAPFQWSVIRKPEVWGGILGAFSVICFVLPHILPDDIEARCAAPLASSSIDTFPLLAFPVGIGEEALFRGYLQSLFSETLSPWGGIILSSLCFGAAHVPNALLLEPEARRLYYTFSLPLITSLGVYMGWLTYKNCSLKESVALHSWYDFVLFLVNYSVASSASMGKPCFAYSFSF